MSLSFRPVFVLCVLLSQALTISPVGAQSTVPSRTQPAPRQHGPGGQNNQPSILPPVVWQPNYRRYDVVDLGLTAVSLATLVTARIAPPVSDGPKGGVWVDEGVRNALRSENYRGRLRAADFSDVLLGLSVSYALLGDPMVNASWLRGSPDVGLQVGLLNVEVLSLTLGVQQLTAMLVGRERPYGRTCGTDELDENTHSCDGRDRYRSFFSGHTSAPFSLAAATCTHHLFLPLVGNKAWLSCTTGFLVAASSGLLRIVSDNHYTTDVLTGAAVGSLIGFAVPLIHYTTRKREVTLTAKRVQVQLLPTWRGVVLRGQF